MPIFHLSTRENFATKLTREAPTFVFSHVQFIVVPVVVSFPANAAEVGILSSVMLGNVFQNQISSQRFYCTLYILKLPCTDRSSRSSGEFFQQTEISVVSLAVEKTIIPVIHNLY